MGGAVLVILPPLTAELSSLSLCNCRVVGELVVGQAQFLLHSNTAVLIHLTVI